MGNENYFSFGGTDETRTKPRTETEPRTDTDNSDTEPAAENGGTPTGTAPQKINGAEVVGYSVVEEQPKKRGRKAGSTNKAKTQKAVDKDLAQNLSTLIQGFYSLTGGMLQAPYFAVTKEEADSIAQPAAKILSKSQFSEQLNKYSDNVALVVAAGIVTIPRVAIYMQQTKQQKPKKVITPQKQIEKDVKQNVNTTGESATAIKQNNPVSDAGMSAALSVIDYAANGGF